MTMNLNRAGLQTRTQNTVEHYYYLKRAHQLFTRIADEMQRPEDAYPPPDDVVRYMEQHARLAGREASRLTSPPLEPIVPD